MMKENRFTNRSEYKESNNYTGYIEDRDHTDHRGHSGFLKKAALLFSMTIFAAASLMGCGKKKEDTKVAAGIVVETEPAGYGTLEITTDYIASLSPNLTVDVIPLVAGTVEKLPVKVGDRVKAGDLLCQLDDKSADLQVQTAEDAVRSARAGRDAAEVQTDTAKIQADSNVRTLKKTLKIYEKSLDTAQKQLDKLEESRKNIKKSESAAKETLASAKKRYKTAQALKIQYEAFLDENPDCRTTAGLTSAATALNTTPSVTTQAPVIPSTPNLSGADSGVQIIDSAGTGDAAAGDGDPSVDIVTTDDSTPSGDSTVPGNTPAGDTSADNTSGDTPGADTPSNTTPSNDTPSNDSDAAKLAKQRKAQELLAALTEAGLTVEYLSETGIKALSEEASDSQSAYTGTNTGIAQIDTSISTLKSNISQLKTQITTTKESLSTARKLADAADAGSDVYDAQVDAALTGVEAAQYQKDLYRLTAPISGIVDAVNVKDKGMVTQGYAAFTISEKDSMIGTFYVTEEVKNFLTLGDNAWLVKGEEKENRKPGHITSIGTAADPQKGLFKVEAEFVTTGQKELSSGSNVKLQIVSNAVNGELLIPYDCVYYDDGQAYVYRVTDGQAQRADVETGPFNQDYIVISSGLSEGDEVITTWASGLKDGAKVEVVN